MSIIAWTDDMSVGVDHLDGHHKRLIDLVNQLGMAVGAGTAPGVTGMVLGELVRLVFHHFDEEERLMAAAGYLDLSAHRQSHRIMADHVGQLEQAYGCNPAGVAAAELHRFLADWLVHHIRSEDSRYKPALAGLPV